MKEAAVARDTVRSVQRSRVAAYCVAKRAGK